MPLLGALLGALLVGAAGLGLLSLATPAMALTDPSAPPARVDTNPPPPHVPVPSPGTGALMGMRSELTDPTGMPAGIVNGPCTPASDHPFPVVLVHGTLANENFSWQTLAPMLSDAGYCVFGLNYGATEWTTESGDHIFGVDSVQNSAAELAAFVKKVVLPDTVEPDGVHATKVDVVGHSQGGMMPRYMIESTGSATFPGLGDAAYVHMLVGLAPSNHGADAYGLVPIFENLFGPDTWTFPEAEGCGACGEQEAGNPFLTALNAKETASGVLYYVIESANDEVVTPAPNALTAALGEWPSAYLHGPANQVLNERLQDQCPTDMTEHIGIIYDPVALQDVMNALTNNAPEGSQPLSLPQPTCSAVVPPLISG